jgi:O-acetyl-ADP-ribose deacetylase (regulator of RNase III)
MATAPIRLVQGDITTVRADAIVNAANSGLRGGGGVDGAIHRAGGPAILDDLERRYGPTRHCPTGSAVVSAAGDLAARIVVHAVGPVWRGGGHGEAGLLAAAYRTSLDLAAAAGCRTIALPSISTGIYGYPVDLAAPTAIETVARWLETHPDAFDVVTFVLYSADTRAAFERALASRSPAPDDVA